MQLTLSNWILSLVLKYYQVGICFLFCIEILGLVQFLDYIGTENKLCSFGSTNSISFRLNQLDPGGMNAITRSNLLNIFFLIKNHIYIMKRVNKGKLEKRFKRNFLRLTISILSSPELFGIRSTSSIA